MNVTCFSYLEAPLRGASCALLLLLFGCRSSTGAIAPDDGCLGPGRYEAGKGQPIGTCCSGLHRVDQLAAVEEGDEHRKVCATVPSPIYACVKGSCGDGICEEGEKLRCGCPADCPSARWGDSPGATPGPTANRILNLFDAFGPKIPGTEQAFGFSALIHYAGQTILFDAGSSADVLKKNAAALGVDLRQVDFAVASHSHFDHVSGFDYLLEVNPKVTLYFPEDIYWGAPFAYDATGPDPSAADALPTEQRYFSGEKTKFQWTSSSRFWKAKLEFVGKNTEIAPGIHLVATRSPYVGYFSRYPAVGGHGKFQGEGETKFIPLPELSLSLSTTEGEVLIVGCSHSMVDVITRETKAYLSHDIALVMGGFHLLPYGADEIAEIVSRMKDELAVKNVAPAHCTGHLGFDLFRKAYGEHYRFAGLGSTIDFAPALSTPARKL